MFGDNKWFTTTYINTLCVLTSDICSLDHGKNNINQSYMLASNGSSEHYKLLCCSPEGTLEEVDPITVQYWKKLKKNLYKFKGIFCVL